MNPSEYRVDSHFLSYNIRQCSGFSDGGLDVKQQQPPRFQDRKKRKQPSIGETENYQLYLATLWL